MRREEQDPFYSVMSVTYDFGSSPSPTPEPASVFLLGAGLLIVGRAARKRLAGNT
jgi:hypothetical protein